MTEKENVSSVEEKNQSQNQKKESVSEEIKLPDKTIAALKALGIPLDAIFQAAKAQNERIERLERNQQEIIEFLRKTHEAQPQNVETPSSQPQAQSNLIDTLLSLLLRGQSSEGSFFEKIGKDTFFKRIAFGDVMQEAALKAMGKTMYNAYVDRMKELGKLEEEAEKAET